VLRLGGWSASYSPKHCQKLHLHLPDGITGLVKGSVPATAPKQL